MRTLSKVVTGLCLMGLVVAPVAAPLAGTVAEEPWQIVPEDSLRDLRGGMDLGDLVASFAIQRVVEIDGIVVARMQIVISNLDRLANGGMPSITVTGPIAEIAQFMQTPGNISVAGTNASVPTSVASLPATSASQTVPSAPAAPAAAASATKTITAAGSTAAAATATPASPSSASSAANVPASSVSNAHLQASATPAVSAQAVSAQAVSTTGNPAGTTRIIPIGTGGQVVVLSSLPNAAALTTAVQNEVHAATIQTQTTISATLNSIPNLNAISLGNSIRAQMSGGG